MGKDIDFEARDLEPLPVPIPLDYAPKLGVSESFLSHVNAGRKVMPWVRAIEVLRLSRRDPRLRELRIWHMRPDYDDVICSRRHK